MNEINENQSGLLLPITSKDVKWIGQNLDIIGINNGASLNEVIYAITCAIKEMSEYLDITEYELSCLENSSCGIKDFSDIIQALIDRSCEQSNATPLPKPEPPVIQLAECLKYKTPDGDLVEYVTPDEYIKMLGNLFCDRLNKDVESLSYKFLNHEDRIVTLENKPLPDPVFQKMVFEDGMISESLEPLPWSMAENKKSKEKEYRVGSNSEIERALLKQPSYLNTDTLISGRGSISTKAGWEMSPVNIAQSLSNIWTVIEDNRNALKSIMAATFEDVCTKVSVTMEATMSSTNINIYFFGSVPSGTEEGTGSTTFTVRNDLNGGFSASIPILQYLNSSAPFVIDISDKNINTSNNVIVETNSAAFIVGESTCMKTISTIVRTLLPTPNYAFLINEDNSVSYSYSYDKYATINTSIKDYSTNVSVFDSTDEVDHATGNVSVKTGVLTAGKYYLQSTMTSSGNVVVGEKLLFIIK